MNKTLLLSAALLSSCTYKSFQLQDGTYIQCKEWGPGLNTSGWHFENCKDGMKYYEQHQFKQLPDDYEQPFNHKKDNLMFTCDDFFNSSTELKDKLKPEFTQSCSRIF